MSRFDRYMLSQFAILFGFFSLILVAIFWINKAVRMFDRLVGDGQSAWVFIEFTSLTLPGVIAVVLPIATFASVVYVTNRLSTESELTVIQATGFSGFRLIRAVFVFGLLIAIMLSVLVHLLVPNSQGQLRDRRVEISENVTAKLLTEGEFLHPSENITFFIREISPEGELRHVLLSDKRTEDRHIIYSSKRAYLVQDDDATKMVMVNGTAQNLNTINNRMILSFFDDYSYDISSITSGNTAHANLLDHRTTYQLITNLEAETTALRRTIDSGIYVIHNRFAQTLMCIVAALIGFSTLLLGSYSRYGVWWQILAAFTLLVVVKLIEGGVSGIVLKNGAYWPLVYLPFITGIGLTAAMLFLAANPSIQRFGTLAFRRGATSK